MWVPSEQDATARGGARLPAGRVGVRADVPSTQYIEQGRQAEEAPGGCSRLLRTAFAHRALEDWAQLAKARERATAGSHPRL
jgi:hypothetical protein